MIAPGAITDVAGILVGHAAAAGRPTGCTVVLCTPGAVAGVAQRGGAPGTRETDLLRPENTVEQVHAVLLTGGSAFGLDAASGVMRWLEAGGHGFPVGTAGHTARAGWPVRVPIVPAAVLFDLWIGDPRIRPTAETGWQACVDASDTAPAQGNAGAGLGATVGKLFGIQRAMKGGIGTASLRLGPFTVGALVAVNALGDVCGANGQPIAGARTADGQQCMGSTQALLAGMGPAAGMAGMATTIGVVATNARLTKAQATQLAGLAHHGIARAVNPLTPHDGDTLFALGTGTVAADAPLSVLGTLAAEAVTLAIRNAVLAAHGLPSNTLPAARDLAPRPAAQA